ncbi:hypothetical protein EBAPG3_014075 [Nitrosospira lacus]|uniref:Uncharacterized protein n=1 Tax=Nitrosospira lacus TaxID=1288494 RepID=A0A1W6SSQ5_9PROT|nr:hypothetical protein [Nitrosospira lacus]ARO88805.1 hypothetical protein EBAPG3_014075 [Nitrosospira lacus]
MKSSVLTAKAWALASTFIFSLMSMGIVQATENMEVPTKECDVSDSIGPGDSGYLREKCPPNRGAEKKQPQKSNNPSSGSKQDNSRYNTDGTERYDQNNRDKGSKGNKP